MSRSLSTFTASLAVLALGSAALGQSETRSAGGPDPLAGTAIAPALTAVLPPESISTEGGRQEGTALGRFSNTVQAVYSEEMLAEAGIRAGDRITGLSFRADVDFGSLAPNFTVADYQIRMSTAASAPESLDPDFTVNRGADYAVVRSGALSYDGSEYPIGTGYSAFGPVIGFDQAFTYVGGDLLLEYTHSPVPDTDARADAENVANLRGRTQFAAGFDGTVESFGGPSDFVPVVRLSIDRDPTGFENDLICNAATVTDGDIDYDTTGATQSDLDLPASCDEGSGLGFARDLWFRYTPTSNGTLLVSTCGQADYDTRLAAYIGACDGPLTLVGCSDDAFDCFGFTSKFEIEVFAGEEVLIRVGGFADADDNVERFGTGTLTVQLTACPLDVDGSGSVDFGDILGILGAFGDCP